MTGPRGPRDGHGIPLLTRWQEVATRRLCWGISLSEHQEVCMKSTHLFLISVLVVALAGCATTKPKTQAPPPSTGNDIVSPAVKAPS